MPRLEWTVTRFPCRLWEKLRDQWHLIKLAYFSLCFNSFSTWNTRFEAAMEPMFWFVDHFAKYLGPIFMLLVVCLTTSVVVIFYLCILPDVFSRSLGWTVFHLLFGHWLLLNIVFHYVMAAFTAAGTPPPEVPQTVSLCKKCVAPKPPRTHHCSVCGMCVLKMDHHCPWLNNCVGFFNHRYFFLFCVYMWLGTVYVSVTGYDLFREHFYGSRDTYFPGALYPLNMAHHMIVRDWRSERVRLIWDNHTSGTCELGEPPWNASVPEGEFGMTGGHIGESDWTVDKAVHSAIIYEFMLCSGVVIALGLLSLWHARLIAAGQTSIEAHINKKERKRLKAKGLSDIPQSYSIQSPISSQDEAVLFLSDPVSVTREQMDRGRHRRTRGRVFKNPFDFGWKRNWEIFLGLEDGRTFFKNILFPSTHTPYGEGLIWQRAAHDFTGKNRSGVTDL